MRRVLFAVVALTLTACGGSSPTAPQGPQYPAVNGSYAGTVTYVFPELGQSFVCPSTTTVNQTGANISIAPIILGGACGGISIPVGSVSIDTNGSFGNLPATSYTEPSCGVYNVTGSGGFFGRTLQLSLTAISSTCWNFNFTANLSR